MGNIGDVFGDSAVVVWYGRFGNTKSCIERKGVDVKYHDHSILINEGSVYRAAHEIKESLRWDSWDKYYVCRDMQIAKRLLEEVKTEEFWDKYSEGVKK